MDIMFWDVNSKGYITAGSAYAKKMEGVERHHFVKTEDLVENGGLPSPVFEDETSVYYLPVNNKLFQIINPRNVKINKYTLDDWAGKVVIIQDNNGKGVLDIESGEIVISCDKSNVEIYPIDTNFFVVVDKNESKKKIINRENIALDEITGDYRLKLRDDGRKELLREVLGKDGKVRVDRRWTVKALNRADSTRQLDKQFNKLVQEYKKNGYGFPLLYDKLKKSYHNEKDDIHIL